MTDLHRDAIGLLISSGALWLAYVLASHADLWVSS